MSKVTEMNGQSATSAWDALWIDCRLATMAGKDPYGTIEDGALAVKDGRIAWIGPAADLPAGAAERSGRVHRLGGAWVTPGLIDCHTHLVYAGHRAGEFEMRLNGASYEDIARAGGGIVSTVQAVRTADEDALVAQSVPRLRALMAEGVTTVEIKSGYGLDTASELKMLRAVRRLGRENPVTVHPTFLGAHALPPEYAGRPDDYIDLVIEDMLPAVTAEGLAVAVDVFCEKIAFTRAQTERVFQAAGQRGLPVKLHAEQLSDQKGAVLAARYDALSVDHVEYIQEDGVAAIAAKGTVAVLLPGAFYFLRERRKPPVDAFREAGVPMALATDCNPGSSPCTSPLLMMNMGCVLFGLTPAEALAGFTVNAAQALGIQAECGSLTVGRAADLAVWAIDLPAELACRLGGNPCRAVVKAGEIIIDR
jgi:imidazolonepropionase